MAAVSRANSSTRRSRQRFFAIVLLIIGLALGLFAGEASLRIYVWARGWTPNCYAAQLELFRPNERLGYDLQPNFRVRSGVFAIATNSLGLRGGPIDTEKPTGVQRIALLGGSAAFGYFVSDGQEAAALLQDRLRSDGRNVEILNAGVPGYNLYQTGPRFRDVVAPLKPDIVVLYLGWNDLPYIVSEQPKAREFQVRPIAAWWDRLLGRSTLYGFVAYRLLGGTVRLAPAEIGAAKPTAAGAAQFRENLQSLASAIRDSGATMVVCSQACAANPRAGETLRQSLDPNPANVEPMIELGQWLRGELETFAAQQGATFVDVYSQIEPTPELLADYIHLTAQGEQRLANILTEQLRPILDERNVDNGDVPAPLPQPLVPGP